MAPETPARPGFHRMMGSTSTIGVPSLVSDSHSFIQGPQLPATPFNGPFVRWAPPSFGGTTVVPDPSIDSTPYFPSSDFLGTTGDAVDPHIAPDESYDPAILRAGPNYAFDLDNFRTFSQGPPDMPLAQDEYWSKFAVPAIDPRPPDQEEDASFE
jgi:hypothetical protein